MERGYRCWNSASSSNILPSGSVHAHHDHQRQPAEPSTAPPYWWPNTSYLSSPYGLGATGVTNAFYQPYTFPSPNHAPHPDCPTSLLCLADADGNPPHSLSVIIRCAILGSPERKLKLGDIFSTLKKKYPIFKQLDGPTWRNSVRDQLRTNAIFVKVPAGAQFQNIASRSYWTIDFNAQYRPKKPPAPRARLTSSKRSSLGYPSPEGVNLDSPIAVEPDKPPNAIDALRLRLSYSQMQLTAALSLSTRRLRDIESHTLLARRAYATLEETECMVKEEARVRANAEERLLELSDERAETHALIAALSREGQEQISRTLIRALEDIESVTESVN